MSRISLLELQKKVINGERLTREEAIHLAGVDDLLYLGRLANIVKERKTGSDVYFNVNRHINLTNVCVSRCKFCAFSKDKGDPDAYAMTVDDVLTDAVSAVPLGITEVHIVSGLHPDLPFEYYLEVISKLKQTMPEIHIQAFTAVEIWYFAGISGLSVEQVLKRLKDAGLGSMPGGGAEILNDQIRQTVCPKKGSSSDWLETTRIAHKIGIRSNATMLYGHVETMEDRIDHLIALRDLQDETGGFQSFIPLPFHPKNTGLDGLQKPTAFESLKVLALSRLILDNFDHIKAFWIMMGIKVSQLSLLFGVDDLDGTVVEEKITHAAGAETGESISRAELIDLIFEADRIPVERDTLYNVIQVHKAGKEDPSHEA